MLTYASERKLSQFPEQITPSNAWYRSVNEYEIDLWRDSNLGKQSLRIQEFGVQLHGRHGFNERNTRGRVIPDESYNSR